MVEKQKNQKMKKIIPQPCQTLQINPGLNQRFFGFDAI
jgi:hypothetical protein